MKLQGGRIGSAPVVASLAWLALLAGCGDGRESIVENRAEIAAAQAEATGEVAEAREEASDVVSRAQHEAADRIVAEPGTPRAARRNLLQATAEGAYEVAIAQAEGAHRVALERCDALGADAATACRERADAEFELAEARAEEARQQRVPPPTP